MKDIIVDVATGQTTAKDLTEQEILQREELRLLWEFEKQLKELEPNHEEIEHAKTEVQILNTLLELGVI